MVSQPNQPGQVIQYIDGLAFGITPEGRTICLGSESDIRSILANPRLHPNNPTSTQVISVERALQKKADKEEQEEKAKASKAKASRHQQAVELGVARTRKPKTKKPAKRGKAKSVRKR